MFVIAPEDLPTAEYLQERFFSIMSTCGYSSPIAKNYGLIVDDPFLKGGKILTVNERFGDFLLVFIDRWWKGGGHSTFHLQNVFGQQILLWSMTCSGSYEKAAIPTLKDALHTAYTARAFYGGRGPRTHMSGDDTIVYLNICGGDFSHFSADETVSKKVEGAIPQWNRLGGHSCWGGIHTPIVLRPTQLL